MFIKEQNITEKKLTNLINKLELNQNGDQLVIDMSEIETLENNYFKIKIAGFYNEKTLAVIKNFIAKIQDYNNVDHYLNEKSGWVVIYFNT